MPLIQTRGSSSISGYGGASVQASTSTYIEDVFSTYLYTGNGGTQTITNGIDLAGKGGLVWTKSRTTAGYRNSLSDTVSGIGKQLFSDGTNAQQTASNRIDAVYNNGYLLGSDTYYNTTSNTYVSWTFRKQAKFFDVVTYTGNGTDDRALAHSLGSVPGCYIVKATSTTSDWLVYHRGNPFAPGEGLRLNGTDSTTSIYAPANTAPTATQFYVGRSGGGPTNNGNINGVTYVAYLFAHNAGGFGLSGTDNVISCGSFTTDGSGNATVNLGYEPQWVMDKVSSSSGNNWIITDIMRGQSLTNINFLFPNLSNAESVAAYGYNIPTATGFNVINHNSNTTYIYIAIRRGPMKVPTSGTSVYTPVARSGTGAGSVSVTGIGFPPDWAFYRQRNSAGGAGVLNDRLRGNEYLLPYTTQAGTVSTEYGFGTMLQDGATLGTITVFVDGGNASGVNYINYFFRRAPGFFDVVCYTGTGASSQTISHNLVVVPELIIFKNRTTGGPGQSWWTYCAALTNPLNKYGALESSNAFTDVGSAVWTAPTATTITAISGFSLTNSSNNYVAYLFATCAGVSKVGSYTGTGALQTINCGFTGGARFVLIKRTDSTGDWYVWDTARGIVAGNDPHLSLNSTAAEVTTNDSIDTDSTGFIVNQLAATNINVSSATYIYLAIA